LSEAIRCKHAIVAAGLAILCLIGANIVRRRFPRLRRLG